MITNDSAVADSLAKDSAADHQMQTGEYVTDEDPDCLKPQKRVRVD